MREKESVEDYVEIQCQNKCKVVSAKIESTFDDLGEEVRVWNVKTDCDGDWWVVEGDYIPMNLYTQSAYYFGTDEVYSFHMGLMKRLSVANENYDPEEYISIASVDTEITPKILRKLKSIAILIDTAIEVEDFQSIGVQCRETLIEISNEMYSPFMTNESKQPKNSDFKNKMELFIGFYLKGKGNADYRKIYKRMTEGVWDFTNKITHGQNTTVYEASSCVALCIAIISIYENIYQKFNDPISQHKCENCKSKKLMIINYEEEESKNKIYLECEECENITEIEYQE